MVSLVRASPASVRPFVKAPVIKAPVIKALAGLCFLAALAPDRAVAADPWPSEVSAVYRISLNSFEIGTFEFNSSVHDRTYSLTGNARISAMLGLVNWQGVTRVTGQVGASRPNPTGFSFDFKGSKSGSVRMGFGQGKVQTLAVVPPEAPKPGVVPLETSHLKGVLDPLSAILAMSRPRDGNPCNQRLPVFDGKLRFDLVLSFKRNEAAQETTRSAPGAPPTQLTVCRVRVVPIAGHTADTATERARAMAGIEVAFRAVPEASIHVPHRISVPTIAGPATLSIDRIQIRTERHGQIALVN